MTHMKRSRAAVLWLVLLLTAGGVGTLLASRVGAAPPPPGWRVDQPMEVPVSVSAAELASANDKGVGLLTAAGVSAAKIETSRVLNQYENATQDATLALDARGRAVAVLTVDVQRGSIRSLVRFDDLGTGKSGDPGSAEAMAAVILKAVGLALPPEAPQVTWDDGMGAWCVMWRRTIDSVPVPTDGLTVWVTPKGQLRSISNRTTDVSRGSKNLDEPSARARVAAFMKGNEVARQATLRMATLEWRQSNDFVAPSLPDSPGTTLRLVYAVPYAIDLESGLHSEGVLWVDAETGDLLGGSDVG